MKLCLLFTMRLHRYMTQPLKIKFSFILLIFNLHLFHKYLFYTRTQSYQSLSPSPRINRIRTRVSPTPLSSSIRLCLSPRPDRFIHSPARSRENFLQTKSSGSSTSKTTPTDRARRWGKKLFRSAPLEVFKRAGIEIFLRLREKLLERRHTVSE